MEKGDVIHFPPRLRRLPELETDLTLYEQGAIVHSFELSGLEARHLMLLLKGAIDGSDYEQKLTAILKSIYSQLSVDGCVLGLDVDQKYDLLNFMGVESLAGDKVYQLIYNKLAPEKVQRIRSRLGRNVKFLLGDNPDDDGGGGGDGESADGVILAA